MEENWNVLKFTCGLLENSSMLIEKICNTFCDIFSKFMNREHSTVYLRSVLLLDDLNRERSNISVSPYCNSVICCTSKSHRELHRNRRLYFINSIGYNILVEASDSPFGQSITKPCCVNIVTVDETSVTRALEACSKIKQPIEYLGIRGYHLSEPLPWRLRPEPSRMFLAQSEFPSCGSRGRARGPWPPLSLLKLVIKKVAVIGGPLHCIFLALQPLTILDQMLFPEFPRYRT